MRRMKPPDQRTILLAAHGERGARRAWGVRAMDREPPESSVSRREMLKRLGVTTGVAWAAPVLTSIQTPAYAGQAYPPGACPDAVLSGGTDPAETIGVDDDLDVELNGTNIFANHDGFASELPPIAIGPVNNGDQLRVIAYDSFIFGGCRGIDPLYLHCLSTGSVQVLDADGFTSPRCDHPREPFPGAVFYDETFTVNL